LKVIKMRADKNDTTASNSSKEAKQVPATLGALRTAAMRLADTRKKPKLKTRDLVGLLLSHGARAWRCSLPPVKVTLAVKTPDGVTAVRFGYSGKSTTLFVN
jgi:hypothetical protein